MESRSVQIILAAYDALAAQNLERLFALSDPQINVWQTEALPWGGRFHGLAGTKEFVQRMLTHIQPSVVAEEYFEAGEQVIVIGRTSGRTKASKAAFDLRIVHVWTVVNEKITCFKPYIATPEMLGALSAAPAGANETEV